MYQACPDVTKSGHEPKFLCNGTQLALDLWVSSHGGELCI